MNVIKVLIKINNVSFLYFMEYPSVQYKELIGQNLCVVNLSREVIMFKHNFRLLFSVVLNVTNFKIKKLYQINKLFAHFEDTFYIN